MPCILVSKIFVYLFFVSNLFELPDKIFLMTNTTMYLMIITSCIEKINTDSFRLKFCLIAPSDIVLHGAVAILCHYVMQSCLE